jgi:DNA (cytosine-5)-methyltransferase 1
MNPKNNKPTAIDPFCGCGGFSLGFIQAGFNVVCCLDNDFDALNTYWCNLCGEDSVWIGDIPKKKRRGNRLANPGSGWISKDKEAHGVTPVRVVIHDDIRNYHGLDLLRFCKLDTVDCIIGSPPCGSFSKLGKREIGDPRDLLPFEYVRIVLEINPKTLIMENVPEFTRKKLPDGRKVVDCFTKILADRDWDLYYSILTEYGREQ